tara:strand:+ start:371 stop:907 length:537 start_codon:yes stop_codon:yes gene_type:complete
MKSQQKENQPDDERFLFGLVLFDSKDKESKIQEAIESIYKIDYPANKIKIILCSYLSEDKNPDHYVNYANILLQKFRHTRLLLNHSLEKDYDVDHNAFMLCKHADYLVNMKHNQTISSDIFKNISKRNFNKQHIIKQGSTLVIPKKIVSKNYLDFNDYEKMSEYLLEQAKNNKSLQNI